MTKGKYWQFKSASGIFELFKVLGEYSELGTRIGYFKRVKSDLAKQNGGKIDRNILMTAALESRDLMDFARGGKSSRSWNSAVAFANAQIQGWDKFFRTFDIRKAWSKDENVRKEWQRAMIRLAIGGILPALLTFLLNHDKDWYKKDLQDWEKETHWILGEHIRIPKGADIGIRFISNATETFLNNLYNNEPITFKRILKPIQDAMMDLTPSALQPIFECAANYDMFRNAPIVSYRLQKLPENLQYDTRTSWAAKTLGDSSLAKFLFENGLSPQKIDHFIYGYSSNMGKGAMGILDRVMRDKEIKFPSADWLHKKPENYNPALYKRLRDTQKLMSNLGKKERAVLENSNIGSSEKDSRQEMIQKQRIALVEKFFR